MKKLLRSKWWGIVLIAALVLLVGSCEFGDDGTEGEIFTDYKDFSIRVSNNTKTPVVAFADSLSAGNLIGGVPAQKTNYGLKNDPKFFGNAPKQFKIIFITEKQYKDKKDNLASLENEYLTQIYIFWNGIAGENEKVYEISDRLGGGNKIQLLNNTKYDVELRTLGPSGPTLGYVTHGVNISNIFVNGDDLYVYPVFKFVNTWRDTVDSIYPTFEDGSPWFASFGFKENATTQVLNLTTAIQQQAASTKSGIAYLVIKNGLTTTTGIRFLKGGILQQSPTGNALITAGDEKWFTIEMQRAPGSNVFADSYTTSNLSIDTGAGATTIQIKNALGSNQLTLLADWTYNVNVTGAYGSTSNPITATVETRPDEDDGPVAFNTESLFN